MSLFPRGFRVSIHFAAVLSICLTLSDCGSSHADTHSSIEFTRVPSSGDGTSDRLETIEGRVTGAQPGQRVVLFALSGVWWVQPFVEHPYTEVQKDLTWKNSTHPGLAYAALLVDARYRAPYTVANLPEIGGPVRAVATVRGATTHGPTRSIQFSGYQWEIMDNGDTADRREHAPAEAGNSAAASDPWVDGNGFLHLRVTRQDHRWFSSGVKLSRSLGYGSYRFTVRDVAHLEPSAVFAVYTFDYLGPSREMDIEISRWGQPEDKNAQYVIQPYVVPANTVRFTAPSGPLTYKMDWQPGRVSFQTLRGSGSSSMAKNIVAEHVFTSGIPSAGNERIHTNLWSYGDDRHPLEHECEVIIEKFEFLP
jgi:hypothetical protein